MRKIVVRVPHEAQLEVLDELLKKYLPEAEYKIPRPIARPAIEGDKARDFLIEWVTGKARRVNFLRRAAAKEGLVWSTVLRIKKTLPVKMNWVGRNVEWYIEK